MVAAGNQLIVRGKGMKRQRKDFKKIKTDFLTDTTLLFNRTKPNSKNKASHLKRTFFRSPRPFRSLPINKIKSIMMYFIIPEISKLVSTYFDYCT